MVITKEGKRLVAFVLAFVMLLGLLPVAALAGDSAGAEVTGIAVMEGRGDTGALSATNTVIEDSTYKVQVTVTSYTYAINPSIALYEVHDTTNTIIDSPQTVSLPEAGTVTAGFSWKPSVAGTYTLLAVVSVDGGTNILDNDFTKNVTVVSKGSVLESRVASFVNFYITNDLHAPLNALAMRSLIGSSDIRAAFTTAYTGTAKNAYGGTWAASNSLGVGSSDAAAALDQMAMGLDPREYKKPGTEQTYNLIDALLSTMLTTGQFQSSFANASQDSTQLYSLLALEAFYEGTDWQKPDGNANQTRIGAIKFFLNWFKDATNNDAARGWAVAGGRYYSYTTIKGYDTAAGSTYLAGQLPLQSSAVFLLSRWLNDDTPIDMGNGPQPLKTIAQREMNGILTTLTALYTDSGVTNKGTTALTKDLAGTFRKTINYLAPFISALAAAGRSDMIDQLELPAQLNYVLGTTYPIDKSNSNSFVNNTLASLALGDCVTGSSIMTTLSYAPDLTDEQAVAEDLSALRIPELATANLSLETRGRYGSDITWASSNTEIIATDGTVTRPARGDPPATVILTATATLNETTRTRSFTITVIAESNDQAFAESDARELTLPIFVTSNSITLPALGTNGSAITWATSNPAVIGLDGAVHKSFAERNVTLTATLTYGAGGVACKSFDITVGMADTGGDMVTQTIYQLRQYYETHRNLTSFYWDVWAAKSVLGDDFDKYDFSVYNIKNHKSRDPWQGTDYGAVILQILAQGDNPYNYLGTDYVQASLDYIQDKGWGAFANPVFLAMGLEGAGAMTPTMYNNIRYYFTGQLNNITQGPDIAGWSMVPLMGYTKYMGGSDTFGTDVASALNSFKTAAGAHILTDPSNPDYGLIAMSDAAGYSNKIGNTCVVIGTVALNKAGITGFNLQTDAPWVMADGTTILSALYNGVFKDKTGPYDLQAAIAFGDIYRGDNVWTSAGVKHEQLVSLLSLVQPIAAADGSAYTAESFAALQEAFTEAQPASSLNYGFGRAYFTLRDAYHNLKPAGTVSIRILGDRQILQDTVYVSSTENVFGALRQFAVDHGGSQYVKNGAVSEINGLTAVNGAEWRVYNGQNRVADLSAPLAEGAALTFKYTANPSVVPASATLDEQFVRETAAELAMPSTVTDNITLPSTGAFGTSITWQSSNPLYIDPSTGAVKRGAGDIPVTLTATVSGPGGASLAVPFSVIVAGTGGATPGNQYAWLSVTDPHAPSGRKSVYFARQQVEIGPGETAFTILQKTGLNIRSSIHPLYGAYVEAIDGYGEFDGGPNSGWVCKVNGSGIMQSSAYIPISGGDVVEWLYTRDLGRDAGITWEENAKKPGEPANIVPPVAVSNGVAVVTVSESDINTAISKIKESDGSSIIIAPNINGTVTKVSIDFPRNSLFSVGTQTDSDLIVQTPVGSLTIPNSVVSSIASQATGNNVTVSVEAVENTALSAEQQEAVGDDSVYDISIISDGKHISSFNGGSVTISLPYALKDGQDPKNVTVWYLNDQGDLEKMACTYDKATGLATFPTTHLSKYFVRYVRYDEEAWKNPFADVKSVDWFYNAVEFVVKNKLFTGVTATTFEPDSNMTRAMLVTVLYSLEGSPAVTGTNAFTDVKDGQWYTNAVIWASANGIVEGYGNGTFGANDDVNREQMATILYKYAKRKGHDITKTTDLKAYIDASSIADYAQTAMTWANAEGLITGRTTATLVPGGSATRAEVAATLMRFVEGDVK